MENSESKNKQIKATGRRKEASARVSLFKGKGLIAINGKPFGDYFPGEIALAKLQKLIGVAKSAEDYYATIKVSGSGKSGQLDAVLHGLSRSFAATGLEVRTSLKRAGYLTRDPRVRERRKFGKAQKARKGKQSPKR